MNFDVVSTADGIGWPRSRPCVGAVAGVSPASGAVPLRRERGKTPKAAQGVLTFISARPDAQRASSAKASAASTT